jgi:hypothetical protein
MIISLSVLFLLLSFIFFPSVRFALWKDTAPTIYSNTPIEATHWLTSHPELPGPLWADLAFSSYLVYALPERPVWIDTRFEVYPVDQWEKFKAIDAAKWNWQDLLDDTGANLLMISKLSQPDLLAGLERSEAWCTVYDDQIAVIFLRCGDQ